MSKRTPGTWFIVGTDPNEGEDWFWLKSPQKTVEIGIISGSQNDSEQSANAAFIVRACNAHEELVGALRMFVVKHDRLDMSDPMQAEAFMIFKDESMLARMALARAALDKAKGEA